MVGPVLITHWGFSGPGILKLSAWAARELAATGYHFSIRINWDTSHTVDSLFGSLKEVREREPRRQVSAFSPANMPQRLWESLIQPVLSPATRWADVPNAKLREMAEGICRCTFSIQGKSTFKDEFVTAGGISLREVDFKTMESKVLSNCWFAGEVLDIDAVTGGYNFQAAWTTSWIAATAIADRLRGE
jgi:predicted Rossmann fold flavoprotein